MKIFLGAAVLVVLAMIPLIVMLSVPAQSAQLMPQTAPVSLAWFYRPSDTGDLESMAAYFDQFVLTHYDEAHRDTLREMGVAAPILMYLHFESIQDPSLCREDYCLTRPWGNQVAYKPGDFDMIERDHPDWFLRDQRGDLIVLDESFVMMDPGNTQWRQFFLERAKEMMTSFGWDGVFLDNVEASQAKIRRLGVSRLAAYPDDFSYTVAVQGFLEFLYAGYFAPEGHPLFANVIETRDTDTLLRFMAYLDGAMEESWAVGWHDDYLEPQAWLTHMERAEEIQKAGRRAILVSQGGRFDQQRQQFSFASYLLVNQGRASFRYTNYMDGYEQVWLYGNYRLDLGDPLGNRRCLFSAVCWRRFEKGWVLVSPVTRQALIEPL